MIGGKSVRIGDDVTVVEGCLARGKYRILRSHDLTLSLSNLGRSLSSASMIRSAGPDDVVAIADLTVQAYLDGGHMPPGSPYIATLRNVEPRLDETLVLEKSGSIAACVAALPHGHVMAEATRPGEWEFRYLAVHKDSWGSGLGKRLVNAAEDRARRAGAETMVLRVVEHNPRAMRLYEHLGYRHVADRDVTFESSSFPGQTITLLLYAKTL